jgi:hypothetical protein
MIFGWKTMLHLILCVLYAEIKELLLLSIVVRIGAFVQMVEQSQRVAAT